MILPVQITYRNLDATPEIEQWVQEEAAKLDKYYGRLTSCRVAIEVPHAHREHGRTYRVRLTLGVPREELNVDYESTLRAPARDTTRVSKRVRKEERFKDPHMVIRNAFRLARRQLQDYAKKMRGEIKPRVSEPHGRVLRVFPDRGYGFLQSDDGREIYFHRNAVVDADFDDLRPGAEVVFSEEPGENGAQATIVKRPQAVRAFSRAKRASSGV